MTRDSIILDAPPPDVQRTQRKSRTWGTIAVASLLAVCVVVFWLVAQNDRQDSTLATLAGVIDKQNNLYGQVCKLAGGQVNTDPAAREACDRVQRGEPAVPIPVVVTGAPGVKGDEGVGIRYTRQLDRCFIEVALTSGAIGRFGSFCGADGPVGPTGSSGEPGASGQPGEPGLTGAKGVAGTGIADVRTATNPCMVEVALTDGTTRIIGPFCGPPAGELTMTEQDGSVKRCIRDGGSDTAPNYACRPAATATTTTATTTAPLLIPTR